jgi:DNA repair exonuclease SbcCD ATPase subunit
MIPLRVKLRGFLCYKDEQEIAFDGGSLWMLSGLNGSGKSAIFDAITYALFNHHRGGSSNFDELINKESDGLAVEFEFLLDGMAYRARRARKRSGKPTQDMSRREGENGRTAWKVLDDTGNRDGFNTWIGENLGLTYDTFTSSVLLLQGQAEQLLNARPEERRKVLAGIVDLGRFERLHERASEEKKALDRALAHLRERLDGLRAVTDEELAAVGERIDRAAATRERARAAVERLRELKELARGWIELQVRLTKTRERFNQAERLLGDAAAIERNAARLSELKAVLPSMELIANQRARVTQAERQLKDLDSARQKIVDQQQRLDHGLKQARDKCGSLKTLIDDDQKRFDGVGERFRHSTEQMAKLGEFEKHEGDLARTREELARLPATPDRAVDEARRVCDALAAVDKAVPVVARFRAVREELRQLVAGERQSRENLAAVEARGKLLREQAETAKTAATEAAKVAEKSGEESAEARARLQQAREALAEVSQLGATKVCRACGQALTAGHVKEEKRKRSAVVAEAERRAKTAADAHQTARTDSERRRKESDAAAAVLQELRDEFTRGKADVDNAAREIIRRREECGQAYKDVSAPYRCNITPTVSPDWLITIYPSEADLQTLRTKAAGLAAARQELNHAETIQRQWTTLRSREAAHGESLERLRAALPADHDQLRRDHHGLDAEQSSLRKNLDAKRLQLRDAEAEEKRLTREAESVRDGRLKLDKQISEEDVARRHADGVLNRTRKALPEAWRSFGERVGLAELAAWTEELRDLETSGTEDRDRELQKARAGLEGLRQESTELERRARDVPAEVRREPAAVQSELDAALQADHATEDDLRDADHHRKTLLKALEDRRQLNEQVVAAEKELSEAQTLTELLGPKRLQLHLIRRAEQEVVKCANAVLDRVSGGQLYLQLNGSADGEGNSAKALDLLVYNRVSGETPINVAFLSGSQKFRVAVSLALGIGQYASHRHRPIEAVIIDEGFGCLDHVGRQVMIQELQNLGRHMRCILLVSHQAEFAEAFDRGYEFRLENGATRVTPYQK